MLQSPENLLTPYAPRRRPSTPGAGAGGWFDLDDWVGPGHPSTRPDIAKLEAILANSGDFPMERFQGPTGYWGGALDQGIRSYQKRNGLKVDGALRPGGPTISHMRDSFANLFDGHEPPTVEDIDAHQNGVGDDDPGTIAWRKPAVDLSQIPGLPEIDQEADASNVRLVRAMLRTGDIEGYAPLMRDAIDQGGKNALAEVRDLTLKLDDASPGLGGRFAGYIYDGMTKAQRDRLQIKMQGGQPLGTVQVAQVGEIVDAGILGLLGIGTLASVMNAAEGTRKALSPGEVPGSPPPLVPPDDPTRTRPGYEEIPTAIAGPTHTGHPAETPKASDGIETFPAKPGERRKQIVDGIVAELFPNILEARYDDKRGTKWTVKGTNIAIQEIRDAIDDSDIPEDIVHTGGGSIEGEEEVHQKEETIWHDDGTFNRPDTSHRAEGIKDDKASIQFNTTSRKADGSLTKRERAALARLKGKLGDDVMGDLPKMLEGQSEEEYRALVRPMIRDAVSKLRDRLRKIREE